MMSLNFDEKIEKIKKCIQYWKKREMSLLGRITVIKSLLLSMFTQLFICLSNPSVQWINDINKLFFDCIWNGPSKITKK